MEKSKVISPLSEEVVIKIANNCLLHERKIKNINYFERNPPIEYRGNLPVWKIDYEGAEIVTRA